MTIRQFLMNCPTLGSSSSCARRTAVCAPRALACAFLAALCFCGTAGAASALWEAGEGPWATALNWKGEQLPVAGDDVTINNGGTATLATEARGIKRIGVGSGNTVNEKGALVVTGGGALQVEGAAFGGGRGTGALAVEKGGRVEVKGFFTLGSGQNFGGGTGSLKVSGEGSLLNAAHVVVGNRGNTGVIEIQGGKVAWGDAALGVSEHKTVSDGTGTARMNVTGGELRVSGQLILARSMRPPEGAGGAAVAEVTQTGGTVIVGEKLTGTRIPQALVLGAGNPYANESRGTAEATYKLFGGELLVHGGILLGDFANHEKTFSGMNTLALGDANGTGVLKQARRGAGDIVVRNKKESGARLAGYGVVEFDGTLTNNGVITADGFGKPERALDLSRFAKLQNTIDNGADEANGFYAVNRGRLVLPAATVLLGVAWLGESPSQGEALDLVNSVLVKVPGAGAGSVKCEILAPDRDELKAAGAGIVGAWRIEPADGLKIASAALKFRYDVAGKVDEAALRVYQFADGKLVDVTAGAADAASHTISTRDVAALGTFVIKRAQ